MEENKQVVAEWKALNQPRLQEIKKANPELYSAVNLALQYLNQKLGGDNLPEEVELQEEIKGVTISNPLTLDELNRTTIYLPTTEMREEFQKILFDLGGKWDVGLIPKTQSNETKIIPDTLPYYLIDNKGRLEFDNSMDIFETYGYKDITQEWPEMKKRYVPSSASTKQWTLDDFKNIKIIVDTPEKSKKFQELFLGLGGEWSKLDNPYPTKPANFDKTYLITNGTKLLYFGTLMSFNEAQDVNQIYYDDIFPGESESTESQTTLEQSPSQSQYKWPIETYPPTLKYPSWSLNFEKNNGDRKSPTQSAGELKRRVNQLSQATDYMEMILATKFKGNDGNWYIINVGKGGVWTWKQTTPPPTQSTSFTSTASAQSTPEPAKKQWAPQDLVGKQLLWSGRKYDVIKFKRNNPKYKSFELRNEQGIEIEGKLTMGAIEKLLNDEPVKGISIIKPQFQRVPENDFQKELQKMTDSELEQLYSDTYDAQQEFDKSDPEYTELRLQLIEIANEQDQRRI